MYIPQNFLPKSRQKLLRSAPGQSFPSVAVMPLAAKVLKKVMVNTRNEGKQGPSLPYIPSGSFAKAMLIEGADANASVTGNESTVPMQLRITGLVEMPNSKTYDATGCFVGLEAWGDVSSERAIVRTRNISCLKDGKTIDMPITEAVGTAVRLFRFSLHPGWSGGYRLSGSITGATGGDADLLPEYPGGHTDHLPGQRQHA